jgi:hypothetical protein
MKINDLLKFIRQYDTIGMYSKSSNNDLRQYIWNCNQNKSVYYIYDKNKVIKGFIEWYRMSSINDLTALLSKRIYYHAPDKSGTLIWIYAIVCKPNTLNAKVLHEFIRFQKHINEKTDSIHAWDFRKNKYTKFTVRR